MRSTAAALLVTLALGCGAADAGVTGSRTPAAPAQRGTVEIGLEHLRPSFTRDTVIRLNAIVARSLATIREYDGEIGELRRSVERALADGSHRSAATAGLEKLGAFEQRSKRALDDMQRAVKKLRASDERYNAAILAGMVDFVEDVESELRHERERLAARLAGGGSAAHRARNEKPSSVNARS